MKIKEIKMSKEEKEFQKNFEWLMDRISKEVGIPKRFLMGTPLGKTKEEMNKK